MPFQESMELGVVVERQTLENPWEEFSWLPAAVLAPAPADAGAWRVLSDTGGVTTFHAGNHVLDLYRADTEAYVENLNSAHPAVYVVLAEDDSDDGMPWCVQAITASPYEAQDVCDSGEEIVERVVMPDIVLSWITDFVDRHHVEKKFVKRKRDKLNIEEQKFGKDPIFSNQGRKRAEDGRG